MKDGSIGKEIQLIMNNGSNFGWRPVARYITIETSVKPKPYCELSKNDPHKYIHTLLLCYEKDWKDLQFIKKT